MINIPETASAYMPSVDIPTSIAPEIENMDIADKITGILTYEVVGKDEYGIEIKIKSMTITPKKRIEPGVGG